MTRKILSVLWQLPQDIVGSIVWLVLIIRERSVMRTSADVFLPEKFFGSGVSLGHFIFIEKDSITPTAVMHEEGHRKQSMYLGWLYLIVIGLPSVTANIIDRIFHKKWTAERRIRWYYGKSHWWEYTADRLGGVRARW